MFNDPRMVFPEKLAEQKGTHLPKTNSSPLNIGLPPPQKERLVFFQTPVFRGRVLVLRSVKKISLYFHPTEVHKKTYLPQHLPIGTCFKKRSLPAASRTSHYKNQWLEDGNINFAVFKGELFVSECVHTPYGAR